MLSKMSGFQKKIWNMETNKNLWLILKRKKNIQKVEW